MFLPIQTFHLFPVMSTPLLIPFSPLPLPITLLPYLCDDPRLLQNLR